MKSGNGKIRGVLWLTVVTSLLVLPPGISRAADYFVHSWSMAPAIRLTRGVAPTSAAMVLGYYEAHKANPAYCRLIDYWRDMSEYSDGTGAIRNAPNVLEELRLDMGTSVGGTTPSSNIGPGILKTTNIRHGYSFSTSQCAGNIFNDHCWGTIVNEINADRPFVWTVGISGVAGNSLAAFGYTDTKHVIARNPSDPGWDRWYYDKYDNGGETNYQYVDTVVDGGSRWGEKIWLTYPDSSKGDSFTGSGGYTFLADNTIYIDWFPLNNISKVNLEYSTNGGASWSPIVTGLPSSGHPYAWRIPRVATNGFRMRIYGYNSSGQHIAADGSKVNNTIIHMADLVVSSLSNPPATAVRGSQFAVTDTTRNMGTNLVGRTTNTRYFLSVDTKRGPEDLVLGSRTVGILPAGADNTGTSTVTVPVATPSGSYYLLACADDGFAVAERDESNNCRVSSTKVAIASTPDLIIAILSNPPATLLRGGKFTATDTTRNIGTATTGKTTVTRYYLSIDTIKGAGDIVLGSHTVGILPAGADNAGMALVMVPPASPLGSYYLLACADDNNAVAEGIEGNNCRASVTKVALAAPDLVVAALSNPPSTTVPGGQFAVTDTTRNIGNSPSGSTTYTRYYLSTDTVKSVLDLPLGSRTVGILAAGADNTGTRTVTVPATTASAYYYVLACADADNTVVEGNESNNCRASASQVIVGGGNSDLTISALSNPPVYMRPSGGGIAVTDTTRNIGTASTGKTTNTRYYLSVDTTKNAGDIMLSSRVVPILAAGASDTKSLVIYTGSKPLGTYYLLACADDNNAVAESNEGNNCRASATKTTVTNAPLPDLRPDYVKIPPIVNGILPSVVAGGQFTVADRTRNIGQLTTGRETSTRYYLSNISLASRPVPILAPGAESPGSLTVTVPLTTPRGPHYVWACADDNNVVAEIDELNCLRSSYTIDVNVRPDLVISYLSNPPATAIRGGRFSVTDTTRNNIDIGSRPFSSSGQTITRYYLSVDQIKSAGDLPMGSRTVGILPAGADNTGSTTVTVPLATPFGSYYIVACADADNTVAEGNESNNCRASTTKVSIGAQANIRDFGVLFAGGTDYPETPAWLKIPAKGTSGTYHLERYRYYLDAQTDSREADNRMSVRSRIMVLEWYGRV